MYLNKAAERLRNDMDIVKLIKREQTIKEMSDILFNKQERTMMKLQKRTVILTSSSDEKELNKTAMDVFDKENMT